MLKGRVLVLNNSFEPIEVMSLQKAMCKISRDNSSLQVEEWDETRTITSSKGEWPIPSVLRLNYYVDVTKKRNKSGAKRAKIYLRDKERCQYCGIKKGKFHPVLNRNLSLDDLTLDHVFPASRGGQTRPDNLVTACKPCNQRKSDRTPEEARMKLLTSTTLLKVHLDKILIRSHADEYPQWAKYLYLDNKGDTKHSHTGDE